MRCALMAAMFVAVIPGGARAAPGDAPVIGSAAVPEGEWRDAAAVLFGGQQGCTGVLVAPTVVLTAAHCADPAGAVDELIRATRAGGRIATFDYDFETLVVDHPDATATRRVVHAWVDGHHNGWFGRQTAREFLSRGLRDVTVVPQTVLMPFAFFERALTGNIARALPADELERWWRPLRQAAAEGRFFAAQTGFVVSATRP